jgi:hypothetical protein
MKKILSTVAIALVLCACSQKPADKIVDFYNSTTEKIEKVKTLDELNELAIQHQQELFSIQQELSDYEPSEEDQKKIQEAQNKLISVLSKKTVELKEASNNK